MQAHLKEKQEEIMALHAESAAEAFVESLTPEELEDLRERIGRLDGGSAAGSSSQASIEPSVSPEQLRQALLDLSSSIGPASKGGKGGNSGKK